MTGTVLRQDEWPMLAGTPLDEVVLMLPPDTRVIVVQDEAGAVVGQWAVIRYVHLEALWIAPEHQKRGAVGRRLLTMAKRVAQSWGATAVWTAAMTDDVRALLARVGARQLPGDHYVMPIGGD